MVTLLFISPPNSKEVIDMKQLFCLVYENVITLEAFGSQSIKTIGPFETIMEAQKWYAANTPQHDAEIDTIFTP